MKLSKLPCLAAAALSLALTHTAHAGRPLTVDDASVNELGHGHVELWYARDPGRANIWNLSPAFSPLKNFEVAALFSRDRTENLTARAIQGKYIFTPSNPNGCNFGAVFGSGYINETSDDTYFATGLATCNGSLGSLHVNLGGAHKEGEGTIGVWGVAFERELVDGVIGHIERFGQKHERATTKIGLRKEIVPGFQIDGTVGSYDSETIYSVGIKKTF